MIIILSFNEDIHAQAVRWALNEKGVKCEIIDTSRFPCAEFLEIEYLADGRVDLRWGKHGSSPNSLLSHNVDAVWFRRVVPNILDTSCVHPSDMKIVSVEGYQMLAGMWNALSKNCTWVNPIESRQGASSKPNQISEARRAGLNVPKTLITNQASSLRTFFNECNGNVIAKPFIQLGWVEDGKNYLQFAAAIERSHLSMEESIRRCPAIYQQQIPKEIELRVLFCGGRMLTVAIDSQSIEASKIDWRADFSGQCEIQDYTLDEETSRKLCVLMEALGLSFGCIDLILTPAGEIYFLEVNEQGQFLWVEDRNPSIQALDFVTRYFAGLSGVDASSGSVSMKEFRDTECFQEATVRYQESMKEGKFSRAFTNI